CPLIFTARRALATAHPFIVLAATRLVFLVSYPSSSVTTQVPTRGRPWHPYLSRLPWLPLHIIRLQTRFTSSVGRTRMPRQSTICTRFTILLPIRGAQAHLCPMCARLWL